MLWLDSFGVYSNPSKSYWKEQEGHGRSCWFGLSWDMFQSAVSLLLLMLFFAGLERPSVVLAPPDWTYLSFVTSQTLVLPSSRPSGSCQKGAWLLLCQHCTHNGRLQENIWQLLIYRIIRAQYLLWRIAKVPDPCWATCSVCDIWSTPRPKERPCTRSDPCPLLQVNPANSMTMPASRRGQPTCFISWQNSSLPDIFYLTHPPPDCKTHQK